MSLACPCRVQVPMWLQQTSLLGKPYQQKAGIWQQAQLQDPSVPCRAHHSELLEAPTDARYAQDLGGSGQEGGPPLFGMGIAPKGDEPSRKANRLMQPSAWTEQASRFTDGH